MKIKAVVLIGSLLFVFAILSFASAEEVSNSNTDLVKTSTWFIAGPAKENQETINRIRKEKGIIKVTAKDNPVGEIELNVMLTESDSNDGKPTNLSENSKYLSITYKSSHLIKLQAREGNAEGTGCVHGGSHPRIDLPVSAKKFSTIKIPWTDFKQDADPNGKSLDIHNLCKFNFVNYNPVSGATLEIKSVILN
ncbi:hypothetical protein [Flavobacterium panici]|uniref:Secreted protein n=1 Tax=Flavobacterium panici TaxID=2654843 RepID=A0A9N8J3L2_9FLAO|nr:hypothetical protein [Flavobacterium panici]CAC9975665.1 hypothetical protein FLAPXU55_03381 [Flavobacterium panici]